jgi:hypothetical protein
MFQVTSRTSFIWTSPTSGRARSDPATPKPDTWTASKPQDSITRAESAS